MESDMKWNSASSPTTTSDDAHGYAVGDMWRNSTTGVWFRCVSNATSAASWVPFRASGGDYVDSSRVMSSTGTQLATAAITGSYDDLADTPTLADVAESGDYTDLDNKPTIPADGSDVGLADSPGSDGDYVLRRASGSNSWATPSGGGSPLWTTTAITATEVTLAADPTWTNLLSTSVTPAAAGDIIECHFSARCTARPTSESVSMQFLIGGSSIGLRTWTPVVDDVIAVTISARVRSIHASTGVVTFDIGGVYAEGVTTWRYAAALASLDTSGAIPIVWRAYQASGTDMKWLVEDDSARIQTPTARA